VKVLQINSCCGVGSTGRIAADIYKALEEQGHQCKIAYGRGNAPEDIDTIRIGSSLDNYLHVIKTRIFDQHGFGSENATRALIKQTENYDPNIIHLHNVHGYYVNIDILFNYLKEAGKPVVWTLHDCWPFTGHCAYFDYCGCKKWETGCFACPQKREYPASFVADNSKSNYEKKKELFTSIKNMALVTPSQWLAGLVKQSFLREYPVHVIPNGIDLNVFQPTTGDFREKYHLQNKKIVLGVANIWDARKGLKYFLQLADKLDDSCQIVIVGVTNKQKKELPSKILGITRTDNVKQLAEIYTAADVFVNPTLEDNFPTTNLEALACGTPVITFKTGGSPESLDATCGITVDAGDLQKLAEAVEQVLQNRFTRESCIKRSRQFDANRSYADYLNLYNNLLHEAIS
jgi:putative colanic acid biosynthesis glycosyltransferase